MDIYMLSSNVNMIISSAGTGKQ